MGSRGPAPKRTEQRRRRNKPETPVEKSEGAAKVEIPAPGEDWHPAARSWFESLAKSGQSKFYEPSDWATAFVLAESMSRDLASGEAIRGTSMAAYLKGMSSLLVTEGDRRRATVELERGKGAGPASEDEVVTELDQYRRRTSVAASAD